MCGEFCVLYPVIPKKNNFRVPLLQRHLPTRRPQLVRPCYDKVDFNAFAKTVNQCVQHGVFSLENKATWDEFIRAEQAKITEWDEKTEVVYPPKLQKNGTAVKCK